MFIEKHLISNNNFPVTRIVHMQFTHSACNHPIFHSEFILPIRVLAI